MTINFPALCRLDTSAPILFADDTSILFAHSNLIDLNKNIHMLFFHLVMSYGIIFLENSSHSSIIFRIQKKAIRIMEGCGNRVSCRNLFKKLQILPLTSQNMLSLLMFLIQNKFFKINNENHNLDTRQRNNLYLPEANLTIYQKGAYYSGIKIFNNLPLAD
jgi:hypothetical protein